ncbi:unnamed protein product, partial [Trichobilharzia regenti]
WTTEEIVRFQQGLAVHGRDFHQVAKDLQAAGMNKTVKACVEFYYVWKRMNTPSDVKWYVIVLLLLLLILSSQQYLVSELLRRS